MSDQLVGWLQVVIGVLALIVAVFQPGNRKERRRHRRTLRLSCWTAWGIERVRLDLTDHRQR